MKKECKHKKLIAYRSMVTLTSNPPQETYRLSCSKCEHNFVGFYEKKEIEKLNEKVIFV